jgi:hypothetical protein
MISAVSLTPRRQVHQAGSNEKPATFKLLGALGVLAFSPQSFTNIVSNRKWDCLIPEAHITLRVAA